MIASVHGTLTFKSPTEIVVDVGGVGYGINIPVSTFEVIGEVNSTVHLFTHLHVREDAMLLYGFATEEERSLFRLLISVNGIGPKMAQGILSGISVPDLQTSILQGNLHTLTTIPGVGRKIAERLVVELREKIGKAGIQTGTLTSTADPQARVRSEALLALTSLGYNRAVAEKAIRSALQESSDQVLTVETLLKASLRHASGKSQ